MLMRFLGLVVCVVDCREDLILSELWSRVDFYNLTCLFMDNELLSMGQQFSAKGDDESGTIKKGEPQVSKVVTEINLPLLSMIPINSLEVNSVDVSFDMAVMLSYSRTEQNDALAGTK